MSVVATTIMLQDCGIDQERYVDMIRAFKKHAQFSEGAKVLVVGTQVTIESGAYQEVLKEKGVALYDEYVFKNLAGLIEMNAPYEELYEVVQKGVVYAKTVGASHVVYGCTHYPLIDDIFKDCAKNEEWGGTFIDPAVCVAEVVLSWGLQGQKTTSFEASEVTRKFKSLSSLYS